MEIKKYTIVTHSAKQREMILDLIFGMGFGWQQGYGYVPSDVIKSGDDAERRFPFGSFDAIILHTNGYVALGVSSYYREPELDANADLISVVDLISKVASDYKKFKRIDITLNENYTATIIDRCGRVKVGCQEFEASAILNLAKEVQKVIDS